MIVELDLEYQISFNSDKWWLRFKKKNVLMFHSIG